MHRFDYSEITGPLPADIVRRVREISEFRSLDPVRRSCYEKEFSEIRQEAMVTAVACSNILDGTCVSMERVRELVLNGALPINQEEELIAGCRDALRRVNSDHRRIDFDERSMATLHRIMLSRGLRMGGGMLPETLEDMEKLSSAYAEARSKDAEPLLLIPCAIFDFIAVNPFATGSERVARLLVSALLLNEGIEVCTLIPMEGVICSNPEFNLSAFAMSSGRWNEDNWSYIPYLRFFLGILLECYRELDRRFPLEEGRKVKKKDCILKTVEKSQSPISKSEICSMLPDISRRTADTVLAKLIAEGKIIKKGSFRDAKYVCAENKTPCHDQSIYRTRT